MPQLLIDAHQDLAWNMLTFGRDYTRSAAETRRREAGGPAPLHNGDTLLGYPDYLQARAAVIFATLFAAPQRARLGEWDNLCYTSMEEAHSLYRRQLDAYHRLTEARPDRFRLLDSRSGLDTHWQAWQNAPEGAELPVGLVILMENAEGVRSMAELPEWYALGVRIIGPAWAGTRFCGGTREPGPLTKEGFKLLAAMSDLGMALDLSHMDEQAALQALDEYPGVIIASHANALSRVKHSTSNRHLSDRVIDGLVERQAVIGVIPSNNFLLMGWKDAGGRSAVSLELLAEQIDYICQRAGNARHVGFGTDFDGGFGLQSVPHELDTITDMHKMDSLLEGRGYSLADRLAIFHANWLGVLNRILK